MWKLYVRTTKDDLELPIAVADSPTELAKMIGVKVDTVNTMISRKAKGYYKIEIEDEEFEKEMRGGEVCEEDKQD